MTTVTPLRVLPAAGSAVDAPGEFIFELIASSELPRVDLSRTLAKKIFSERWHRAVVQFMGSYFHLLAWCFRLGIACFGGLLYFDSGSVHTILKSFLLPSTQSLFATLLFESLDVLRLLVRCYEFWFMTTVNALNWLSFAVILGDSRVLMSFLGWFGFQIVIMSDASFRTTHSTVKTIIFSLPFLLILAAVVVLKAIHRGHFFALTVHHVRIYGAVDIMSFTTSTLMVMLAKMIILKERRALPPRGGSGFRNVPCVLIRTNLRLVPVSSGKHLTQIHPPTRTTWVVSSNTPSSGPNKPTKDPFGQTITLSRLPTPRIDTRRTILPFRLWSTAPPWIFSHQHALRVAFYALGTMGFVLLLWESVCVFRIQVLTAQNIIGSCILSDIYTASLITDGDRTRAALALLFSVIFCGSFALFFQRDLLWLLLTNFDYVFSNVQVAIFCCCIVDMTCWQPTFVTVISAWLVWFKWALSIDALSPVAKQSIFRFCKKSAAIVIASVQLVGLAASYIILFLSDNGVRNRTIANMAVASHAFRLTTKSIMIGRIATISLWCTRQAFVLHTRDEDELNLIRGLVQYESPYTTFPLNPNENMPAINDADA